MANTIGWGKGTQNNTNGWGKYQNTIDAGSVYADSYAGETVLVGTSAAFSYSASSFHQGEADPTPTITGTTGGTFSATPSGLSINTSTGTIDLDNSTIQSYTITYTVSGVSANQTLAVTASPFVVNNHSMQFDSASSQYIDAGTGLGNSFGSYNGVISFSMWINPTSNNSNNGFFQIGNTTGEGLLNLRFGVFGSNFWLYIKTNGSNQTRTFDLTSLQNTWIHVAGVWDLSNSGNSKLYLNGSEYTTEQTNWATGTLNFSSQKTFIGLYYSTSNTFNGKIDEVAIWNAALSSDAVQEIYNATANNTGKVLDLNTDTGNYTSSANLQYWNRLGD